MITLTEKQIQDLQTAILEIPGKYGLPILQLLGNFANENQTQPTIENEQN